jgi:hypothetical protein
MQKTSKKNASKTPIDLKVEPKVESIKLEPKVESIITHSKLQTKKWRMSQTWYEGGKKNECEKYQLKLIKEIIGQEPPKTYDRIYNIDYNIIPKEKPLNDVDGYEYTENFDGKIIKDSNIYYYNLKFVCDKGGAQTRTLREVYSFIHSQLEHMLRYKTTNKYFINILDGDECYSNINKIKYLIINYKNNIYEPYKKYMFIGDMTEFKVWFNEINKPINQTNKKPTI